MQLFCCIALLVVLLPVQSVAQDNGDTPEEAPGDTLPPPEMEPADLDTVPDGILQEPSTPAARRQTSPDAVNFQSSDSLVFRAGDEKKGILYGSANVSQEENQLSAGKISLFLNINEVHAQTDDPADTLSYPVLTQGDRDLKSRRILFNYETERGKFDAAEVQVSDGHLIGNKVKNVSRTEVFVEEGRYSTCPPTHMYYYIEAQKMKVVDEEEIFFTNARLFLLDIPYPLVFPFGYVPSGMDSRQSGLLEPTYVYQNTSSRGIGLQNLGWFQYFNDYLVGQTSFDLFTSGTFFNESRMQYRSTNRYNGTVTLGYSSERGLESTDPDYSETVNRRVGIQHSQDLSPYASLNANINLRTADYYQRTSYDIDERAETSSSSSLTYRYRHPENTFNFNITNRLNQQFTNNTTRLTGPQMSFSLRQFAPFERDDPTATEQRWYETISVRYNNDFDTNYNFRPTDGADADINWFEALLNPSSHREATGDDRHIEYGFRQQVQTSASNLIPSQHLNASSSLNITEYWYPTTIRREWNEEEEQVETRQVRGFAATRQFNTGVNFTTTFYGISQAQIGNLEGFRHTLRPNIGFSYRPDFSDERWGVYREVQVDTTGRTQEYSIFQEEVFGGPGRGEQMNLNFGITNIFETKQVRRDSTGEVQSNNLRLIDNLSLSSSYNFAADSLNFSQVNASLSTRVIEGVNLSMSANFSLYSRDDLGREVDRFIWQETNKYLQPLSYSISASYSVSSGQGGGQRITTPMYGPYDPLDQGLFGPVDVRFNNQPIQNFSSPWSASFSFSYRWNYQFEQEARKSATLNVNNIRFNLTPKWDVSTRLGYDFIDQELTPSQFSLTRRMVCWTMSFQFSPFGDFQYYFFRLSIDSGQVQSLFQKLPLLNNLERSSSPTGRAPRF
ncbi:MAG: putative LPS assembly protein LptD [Balneolaceae bacterium]